MKPNNISNPMTTQLSSNHSSGPILDPIESIRFFAMADIHGEFDKVMTVMDLIKKEANFDPTKDQFVNLGDKNDRGPKTFEVFEYFREMDLKYPGAFILVLGNHEDWMMQVAKTPWECDDWQQSNNGGRETLKSYGKHTGLFGVNSFMTALENSGHKHFLSKHVLFYETEDYFFSHAPIPQERYRHHPRGFDFRYHKQTLLWSYPSDYNVEESEWIDPFLIPKENGKGYKLCCSGHIHGMYEKREWKVDPETGKRPGQYKDIIVVPGVRRYANSVLLDTGSGCAEEGYLSCLELPAMKVYTSRGEIYQI